MSEMNELNWKKYEAITKYIYETLGQASGVKIDGWGPNCKLIGKSGVQHQIDVLTSHSDGIHSYRTAIECKYWNEKIDKDIIMKVSEVIEDAGIENGIIVAKSGFTQDGVNYAKHKNIRLVELKETDNKDQHGRPEIIDIATLEVKTTITLLRPEISNILIDYVDTTYQEKEEINIYRDVVKLPNGNMIPLNEYAKVFQEELHTQNQLFQPISKSYEINEGILINKGTNTSARIKRLNFTGMLKRVDSNQNRKISFVDQVWLIMSALFEKKTFKITENGIIVQDRK
ncbi:MAG: restriction endonuclease [Bacteroidetes bacterium]|nr:restriction endonuclease [Bacteroidota bacterium]